LFGARGIIIVWSAMFVAFVLRLVTLKGILAESDTPTNMLVPAVSVGMGICGLLRLNLFVMAQGMRWAATTVIVTGIVMVFVFAMLARTQTNLKTWTAQAAMAHAGFALIGMGSCTPQGIAAAVHVTVSLMLGIGMLAMFAQAFETRVQAAEGIGGLSEKMPLFTAMYLLAVFVLMGLPGLAGFWGPLLAIVGVFPRQPMLAIWAIVATVVLCATCMRFGGRMLFGAVNEKNRQNKWPALRWDERLVLVPLAVMVIGLGVSPRTLFSLLDAVILDLHRMVDVVQGTS
jgi:NADH-quinone oxidoreductase subunit M